MLGIKEFAHCQRSTALLPQQSKVVIFLGWQWILQKKEPVLLQFFAQANRLIGSDTLMNVMQQLYVVTQFAAQVFKQFWHQTQINCRFPDVPRVGGANDFLV